MTIRPSSLSVDDLRALFDLFESVPTGQSEVVRRSYTLRSVNLAPTSVQHRF